MEFVMVINTYKTYRYMNHIFNIKVNFIISLQSGPIFIIKTSYKRNFKIIIVRKKEILIVR
jgi:hypothetical protein